MIMSIYQIIFIVVALSYRATSKGYGPGTDHSSRGIGGRPSLGGAGSYAGGIIGARPAGVAQSGTFVGAPVNTGGIIGATPVGVAQPGAFIGATPVGVAQSGAFIGAPIYTGGVIGARPVGIGQKGPFTGAPGYVMPPQPYSISYEARGEQGGVQYKTESGDGSGNVQGNYGYTDSQGLYRQVDYRADEFGFRATIKTNEPGVGKESPADVNMIVGETPAGIQGQAITGVTGYQTGISGGPGVGGGSRIIGMPGLPVPGSQGITVRPGSIQYQGEVGGRQPGTFAIGGGSGPQSVGSGQFVGIKKSSSGKSTY